MTSVECVRQLFRSGVRDVDEVAERCGLTRETARKYLARVRRESEAKAGDVLADVEKTKRAIELVKRGEASDPSRNWAHVECLRKPARKSLQSSSQI